MRLVLAGDGKFGPMRARCIVAAAGEREGQFADLDVCFVGLSWKCSLSTLTINVEEDKMLWKDRGSD